jgi:site-specific recombinase XerD
MLEKSFGLLFFLKQSKNQSKGPRYVYLRITVDGVSKELSSKRLWDPGRWNSSAGRAAGAKEDARMLNNFLEVLAAQVHQARKNLVESSKPVMAETLKQMLTGKADEKKMILAIFKTHNEQMKALLGTEYAPATLMRYKTAHDHTAAFIKWQYNLPDLALDDMNYEFLSQFAFWLRTVRKCGHNATMKYLGNLKKIVLECVKKGWLQRDPFTGFKTNKREVIREALTREELERIAVKDFKMDRLNQVRDIFLFSCFTGLAYVDVYQLKRSNIVKGMDGEQWLMTHRQKTDAPTRLPLLPDALKIMARYDQHPKCLNDGSLLPVLTNQKMNSYLKEIADGCGISKNLTFHIARHTFATTVTLSNGVPIETVSKMLGHSKITTTQIYAKVLEHKISADMSVLKDKLSGR